MPLFFFDFSDGDTWSADDHGVEFADGGKACAAALAALPAMARDERLDPDEARDLVVAVRDESGTVIYRAVLTLRGERPPMSRSLGPSGCGAAGGL